MLLLLRALICKLVARKGCRPGGWPGHQRSRVLQGARTGRSSGEGELDSPPDVLTNPLGVTKRELIATLGHQPATADHDPRNDVLTSAARAQAHKHEEMYDVICAATGTHVQQFALETTTDTVPFPQLCPQARRHAGWQDGGAGRAAGSRVTVTEQRDVDNEAGACLVRLGGVHGD